MRTPIAVDCRNRRRLDAASRRARRGQITTAQESFMRKVLSLAVLSLTLALGGCLLDATIDAKGAGDMTVSYKLPKTGKIDDVKKQMESPNVKVTSAEVNDKGDAVFKLKFDDITKLSTAKFFKSTTTTVTED